MFNCLHSAAAPAASLHFPPACHHHDASVHAALLLPVIIMPPLPARSLPAAAP